MDRNLDLLDMNLDLLDMNLELLDRNLELLDRNIYLFNRNLDLDEILIFWIAFMIVWRWTCLFERDLIYLDINFPPFTDICLGKKFEYVDQVQKKIIYYL